MAMDPMRRSPTPKTRKPVDTSNWNFGSLGKAVERTPDPNRRVSFDPAVAVLGKREAAARKLRAAELAMVKAQIERLRATRPSCFLVPNVAQARLLRPLAKRPFPKDLIFLGGNGAGKTVNGTKIVCGIIWGPTAMVELGTHPDYTDDERSYEAWTAYRDRAKEEGRPIAGRLVANADSLRGGAGALMQRITRYFPKKCWEGKKIGKAFLSEIWCWETPEDCAEGDQEKAICIIEVKTHEQDPQAGAGPDLDFIWFDEPPPPEVYEEAIGRGRANPDSIRIYTLTPLEMAGWLVDELVKDADGQKIVVVYGSLWDNCGDWHPTASMWSGGEVGVGRPLNRGSKNVVKSTIDSLIDAWRRRSPMTVEARVNGTPTHTAGSIYSIFSPAVHIKDAMRPPEEWVEWPIWNVIDPHHKRPPAVGWFLQCPNGKFRGLGEYPFDDYTKIEERKNIPFYAEMIQQLEKDHGLEGRVVHRWGDPNTLKFTYSLNGGDTDDSMTIQDLYSNEGLFYECANDNHSTGHEALNEMLFYDVDQEIGPENEPALLFLGNIFNSWRPQLNFSNSLSRYKIKPKAIFSNHSPANVKTIVEETWKDFADVARYFAITAREYPFKKIGEQRGLYDEILMARFRVRASAGQQRRVSSLDERPSPPRAASRTEAGGHREETAGFQPTLR